MESKDEIDWVKDQVEAETGMLQPRAWFYPIIVWFSSDPIKVDNEVLNRSVVT